MSEVRLNILDSRDAIHGTIHGSVADAVIAALSAEPETIGELDGALDRFNKRIGDYAPFGSFAAGEDVEPWDAGVVIVDLAARIVASESSYSAPLAQGEISYHDGNGATDVWLRYRLPSDWVFLSSVLEYEALRNARRAARSAEPLIDIREVLYGRPMFEFLVAECLAENAKPGGLERYGSGTKLTDRSELETSDEDEDSSPFAAVLRAVHARWLMTPRDELAGRTPREVILEKREFLTSDIEDRAMQWSLLRESPPPLSRDSRAYLFAGFGNHEYVVYYDFVRQMLMQCWERINRGPTENGVKPELMQVVNAKPLPDRRVDQRGALVTWLEAMGNDWLNEPNEDFGGRIPAAIIESERRRVPLVVPAAEMIFDKNCDLCRMLGEETSHSGPGFWYLDGSHMDQEFEFSTYATREEWEAEQRHWQAFHEEFERKRSARNHN